MNSINEATLPISGDEEEDLCQLEEMRKLLLAQLNEDLDDVQDDELNRQTLDTSHSSSQPSEDERENKGTSSGDSADEEEREYGGEGGVWDADAQAEIDNMLEQPVEERKDEHGKRVSKRFKRVLEHRKMDHFDVLPDGWVEITHSSGLPVYLHKPSRCCTFSRPYFIGHGSVRNHKVPESAIPCLFQRKFCTELEKKSENANANDIPFNKLNAPCVKIKTESDQQKAQLTGDELYEYAKNRFKFKNICVLRFGKWSTARDFYKKKKVRKAFTQSLINRETRPGLPSSVRLVTVPALEHEAKPHQRTFYLNPQGKTSVSILHEFVQKVLKCTVRYLYNETRSSATPYHCVAKLVNNPCAPIMDDPNGDNAKKEKSLAADCIRKKLAIIQAMHQKEGGTQLQAEIKEELDAERDSEFIELGQGYGAGKKSAKLLAAKDALHRLIPGIDFDEEGVAVSGQGSQKLDESTVSTKSELAATQNDDPFHFFDMLSVTDTRIPELCARAGQPSPYLVLQEYLKRYAAYGDTAINMTTRRIRHQMHEFELKIGENSVKVVSTNKREGKQKAAQAMLAKLHPNDHTWGAILRLYGFEAQQKFKEARKCKDSVTKLQSTKGGEQQPRGDFQPNLVILDKLRSEMVKLSEGLIRESVVAGRSSLAKSGREQPPAKMRRTDFQSELPILSEEELRKLSAKIALPEENLCVPSLKF